MLALHNNLFNFLSLVASTVHYMLPDNRIILLFKLVHFVFNYFLRSSFLLGSDLLDVLSGSSQERGLRRRQIWIWQGSSGLQRRVVKQRVLRGNNRDNFGFLYLLEFVLLYLVVGLDNVLYNLLLLRLLVIKTLGWQNLVLRYYHSLRHKAHYIWLFLTIVAFLSSLPWSISCPTANLLLL